MNEDVGDKKRQHRRYALALITFLVFLPGTFGIALLVGAIATSVFIGGWDLFISAWNDPEVAKSHEEILYISLSIGVLAMVWAWYMWDRLFLRSGYLNTEMVALMNRGHMPGKAETWRKRVGYIVYSFIFGAVSWGLYVQGELVLALIFFAVTVYTVVHAWRSRVWKKNSNS
ncbi:MAG: hypothetical protein IV108_11530 [Burkholderiales bacterium]|nr:hypothetical protein [Burkholderiales bacterium]